MSRARIVYDRQLSLVWRGDKGAGTWENKGGRWAGCGSHARAGDRRRMRNIKFFNDFLVCF